MQYIVLSILIGKSVLNGIREVSSTRMTSTNVVKIAMLIPVCSRHQWYGRIEDIPLLRSFLPNFLRTTEEEYEYKLYVGYDDDDEFYRRNADTIRRAVAGARVEMDMTMLEGCQHNPVRAWNYLFGKAVDDGNEYFFQIGDDVELKTHGWTTRFIERLKKQDNIGTVAPCEPMNYFGRLHLGKPIVNENNFVHRTHHDIFGYFFFPSIRNWYCDDWITFVYDKEYASMDLEIRCANEIKGGRYDIDVECPQLDIYVQQGKAILQRFLLTSTRPSAL